MKGPGKGGFILLSVLLSVTVLLSAATGLAWFARSEVRMTEERTFQLRARSAAFGALKTAEALLAAREEAYDSLAEAPYRPGSVKPLPPAGGLAVRLSLVPLDDRIPLGSLFLPDGFTVKKEFEGPWERLFLLLGKPELGPKLLDYMDGDTVPRMGGKEEDGYLNRPAEDLSQFLNCPGVDRKLLYGTKAVAGLRRFVTPFCGEKINLNTVDPGVLALLDERLGDREAKALAALRMTAPIKKVEDLKRIPGFPEDVLPRITNVVGVASRYVSVRVQVRQGRLQRRFEAVLERSGTGPKASCTLVRWVE